MSSENYVREQIEQAANNRFSSPMAEENVLLQMLKKPDVAEEALDALAPEDFTDLNLARIYQAMREVAAKGQRMEAVNVDTMFTQMFPLNAPELQKRLIDVMGFRGYGSGALESVRDHIRIVKELSCRRRAIARMEELSRALSDPTVELSEVLGDIQDAADEADEADELKWVSLSDVNLTTYEYLEARQNGEIKAIPTGIRTLDDIVGGLFGGELTIVAARPSVGKSAFGLNMAIEAAKAGFKVGFISCEMDDRGFGQRTISRGAWVDGGKLRKAELTVEDWDHIGTALADMGEWPIQFLFNKNTKEGITVETVFRSVKKQARHGEIDLLIVDYIGIMRTTRAGKEERLRIAYISSELKRLAMVANIPVVALCQVNRQAQGQMPTMAQLRDSGAVEQDADGIIFLHRPESHEDRSIHPDDVKSFYQMQQAGGVYLSVSVAKQRNGATGITNVMFEPGVMRYSEIMRG